MKYKLCINRRNTLTLIISQSPIRTNLEFQILNSMRFDSFNYRVALIGDGKNGGQIVAYQYQNFTV